MLVVVLVTCLKKTCHLGADLMGVDFFPACLKLGVLAIQISTSVWRIVPNSRRWKQLVFEFNNSHHDHSFDDSGRPSTTAISGVSGPSIATA